MTDSQDLSSPCVAVSEFVRLDITTQLHLRRLAGPGPVVFLLHGALSNGRLFYQPERQKGFAAVLARAGYDVFIGDLGGRGLSAPPLQRGSWRGQRESIQAEIPAMLQRIAELRPGAPVFWGAHSWGGVLLMATLARFPQWLEQLQGVLFFGSKRSVRGLNWEKLFKIYFFWNCAAFALVRIFGYLPARALGLGADDESQMSHWESVHWVREHRVWRDPFDGFDYAQGLQALHLPPLLYLVGAQDLALGHLPDVERFRQELHAQDDSLWLLGREQGYQQDYDHISMLTHGDAYGDHFPQILDWMSERVNKS